VSVQQLCAQVKRWASSRVCVSICLFVGVHVWSSELHTASSGGVVGGMQCSEGGMDINH